MTYEPRRFRLNEAAIALMTCATTGIIVSLALRSPWGYLTGAIAVVAAFWSVRRAFRIRLVVTADGVIVDNYWTTRKLSWSEVEGVGVATKQQGVLPQPALAFRLRAGGSVFAKATPFRQTERQEFQAAVLALAPSTVVALPDAAARFGIGSDRALSNRLRLWWLKQRAARGR